MSFNKLMNTVFLFGLIGVLPGVAADWNIADWQWWAFCAPLWIGIFWRDWIED